ncbi:MAG: PPOX class F420-dependent oxidoreductase [Actinomycetota bacterium]|nr:PPOX class F420-dependent oxidoreductase [Actinomycetota bacterium]
MTDQTEGAGPDGGLLDDRVRLALTSGHLAHLVTLGPGGDPQVTLVWVGIENGEIVAAHLGVHQKVKNIRRDPRVVLSLETGSRNQQGLDEYLVVYGRARITEGGAPELLQRLAWVYIGPDVKFPPMDNPPPGYVTRITPERVAGVGPWSG